MAEMDWGGVPELYEKRRSDELVDMRLLEQDQKTVRAAMEFSREMAGQLAEAQEKGEGRHRELFETISEALAKSFERFGVALESKEFAIQVETPKTEVKFAAEVPPAQVTVNADVGAVVSSINGVGGAIRELASAIREAAASSRKVIVTRGKDRLTTSMTVGPER